jgi:hypothetical protein
VPGAAVDVHSPARRVEDQVVGNVRPPGGLVRVDTGASVVVVSNSVDHVSFHHGLARASFVQKRWENPKPPSNKQANKQASVKMLSLRFNRTRESVGWLNMFLVNFLRRLSLLLVASA